VALFIAAQRRQLLAALHGTERISAGLGENLLSEMLSDAVGRLRAAGPWPMTAEDHERQVVSFAYGNAALENPRVTRKMAEEAARRTRPSKKDA
jgi:hypothetical protein